MKVTSFDGEIIETLSVKELIEKLKQMPQELPVCHYNPEYDYVLIDDPQVVKVQKDRWCNFNDPDDEGYEKTEQAVSLFQKRF